MQYLVSLFALHTPFNLVNYLDLIPFPARKQTKAAMDPNEMRRRREAREGRGAFWASLHRGTLPSVRRTRGGVSPL